MFFKSALLRTIVLSTLFLFAFVLPSKACDTSPVVSASNVTNIGGGNYTVDVQACVGVNGSMDGFDCAIGCGLSILSVNPTSLTNAGNTANASISGNTVSFNCASCNSGNWFADDDFIAGPCFNFTITVNGNPENCNLTFTGLNDGCLIIQSSWTTQIPGPCLVDFNVTGAGTYPGNTTGAGNNCNLRSSNDQVFAINLPCNDLWTFSLCGSASWDTYLYLGSSCCTNNFGSNDDFCGLQSQISNVNLGPGVVYVTVEAFSSGQGAYALTVSGVTGCPLEFEDIGMTAIADETAKAVYLNWNIDNEMNVESYFLERSTDGLKYDKLNQIQPKGVTQNGSTPYGYTDNEVKDGILYTYRLNVHSTTGETYYSNPVSAFLMGGEGLHAGQFYPNPSDGNAKIDFIAAGEEQVLVEIFDLKGAIITSFNLSLHEGKTVQKIDISGLGAGLYTAKISGTNSGVLIRKILIR